MTAAVLAVATARGRRRPTVWWAVGMTAMVALIVSAYGAVKDLDEVADTFESAPESVRVLLGLAEGLSLTSPAGYLNGRLFANFLPILLSIFGIGAAAAVLAGEEGAGRLELLLAHPVRRARVAAERGLVVLGLVVGLAAVSTATLLLLAPTVGLDEPGYGKLLAASVGSLLLALLHTAVTFGVGAAVGSRGVAVAVGSAVTGGGFLLQSLATVSSALRPVRWITPWHWFLDATPVLDGWGPMILPMVGTIVISILAVAVGIHRFQTRDIGSA